MRVRARERRKTGGTRCDSLLPRVWKLWTRPPSSWRDWDGVLVLRLPPSAAFVGMITCRWDVGVLAGWAVKDASSARPPSTDGRRYCGVL